MQPSSKYIAESLRSVELYPKLNGMIDYIISNYEKEFEDVKYKYRGPDQVRNEVIKEIIDELGFKYIADIMDTISDYEFNSLLEFLGLINLLKGTRDGIELVMKLLGFDSIITEWWEKDPSDKPHTYDLIVVLNSSTVTDPFNTLNKVKIFARHYVYPILNNVDFKFTLTLAEKNVTFAGFTHQRLAGDISCRL